MDRRRQAFGLPVGRRVRIGRADFDRLIQESYIDTGKEPSTAAEPSIWDGEVPPPQVP